MMNYFSSKKKWMAYLVLLTFVFTCIVPTNLAEGNSAWAAPETVEEVNQRTEQILKDGGSKSDDYVTVSKVLTPTGHENYFDITLTVETETNLRTEMQKAQEMAVVIVMDISNTMNSKMDPNNSSSPSRYDSAMAAAKSFIDILVAKNDGVKREVGFVAFNTSAHKIAELQDCKTKNLYASISTGTSNIINASGYDKSNERYTNIEAGLAMANNMLNEAQAPNKYVIFLSDGFPTTYSKTAGGTIGYYPISTEKNKAGTDGYFYDNVVEKLCRYGTSYSDKGATRAQNMAAQMRRAGVMIYSVGVALGAQTVDGYYQRDDGSTITKTSSHDFSVVDTLSNDYVIGKTDSDYKNWLKNSIGSGYYYDSTSKNALVADFGRILESIELQVQETTSASWVASDLMNALDFKVIDFQGFYNSSEDLVAQLQGSWTNGGEDTATFQNDRINWDLKNSGYKKESGKYIYSIKYRVRLANESGEFEDEKEYATNGTTDLNYKVTVTKDGQETSWKDGSIEFPIPSVKGYLGELSFIKIDSLTNEPLAGAEFALTHKSDCSVCGGSVKIQPPTEGENQIPLVAVSDADGKVSFTNIPSGHDYVLTEAKRDGYLENKTEYPITVAYGDTDYGELLKDKTIANTPENTAISVIKTWDDANNQDGFRPDAVNVQLQKKKGESWTKVGETVALNDANEWKYSWEPPVRENGKVVEYRVVELGEDGTVIEADGKYDNNYDTVTYTVSDNKTTITNKHIPETIGLQIEKMWSGDENITGKHESDTVTFTVEGYVDGNSQAVVTQNAEASAANDWKTVVNNLPRYNDGKLITYTVSEDVPEGYTVSWDKDTVKAADFKDGETASVTATNTLQRAGILFVKDYVGGVFDTTVPNDAQAAQFKLKAEETAGGEEIILKRMGNTYSTTAGALQFGVMYTLSEMIPEDTYVAMPDRYLKLEADANGKLQVAEYDKEGKPVVQNDQNVIYPVQTDGYIKDYAQLDKILNYPENATVNLFGNKSWVGGTTDSAITLTLLQNGNRIDSTEISAAENWHYEFKDLNRYDENGKSYVYTVEENSIAGFTPYYGYTTTPGAIQIDIVNVKNELSIDSYGDIWVEKQTNNDDLTTEYGFELWIQALKDESSNLNQEQQRDKTMLATALNSAKNDVTNTYNAIAPKVNMFEDSAFATSGSQYRFFVTEADNCTTKLGVTTDSALTITGVNMRIAEDANYEGNWFTAAIEAIKTLVAEMAEAFVSGGQARPNTEEMLTIIRDNVTVTSGSALAYSEEGLTGMFDAMVAYQQAQKDLTAAENAFAAFEASLSTPSSLILTVKGESPITLNPNEGTAIDGGKVFTVSGNSKVQNVYYYEDGKYYVVPFTLVKNERIDFHMEATTGSAIQYKVTEVNSQSANSTDLTIHFSADNKLTKENTLTSGILELTSGSAIGFEFLNKFVSGGNTGTDPITKEEITETITTEENDPEENIPDENVPTGSVEPGEPLDELEDPEIPLGDAPATGDTNNAVPFMALLLAAIAGLVVTRRKFN